MNRAGAFFEGWSSGRLYYAKLIPAPKLVDLRKSTVDEKQKYLGEKMLRKWYLRVAGDMHFTWPEISSCLFPISSVLLSTEGQASE